MQDEKPRNGLQPDNNSVEIKSRVGVLFAGLQEANRLFVEGKDAGRLGAIEALNTVAQFLLYFEGTTDLRQPFIALLNALVSLNDGQVLPLLEPYRRPSRPPASAVRQNVQAMAAITVHRLRETGLNINEAYEKVAQVCREAGVKPGRSGKDSLGQEPEITARTVRFWCEKIEEDVGRHSEAAKAFDRLRQSPHAQAIKSEPKEAIRNSLLQGLRLSLAQMRAPEH
jgi:hypothetical protein